MCPSLLCPMAELVHGRSNAGRVFSIHVPSCRPALPENEVCAKVAAADDHVNEPTIENTDSTGLAQEHSRTDRSDLVPTGFGRPMHRHVQAAELMCPWCGR